MENTVDQMSLKQWYDEQVRSARVSKQRVGIEFYQLCFILWKTKKRLVSPGKRTDVASGVTWSSYCEAVEIALRTADRWVKNFEQELMARGKSVEQIEQFSVDEMIDVYTSPPPSPVLSTDFNDLENQYKEQIALLESQIERLESQDEQLPFQMMLLIKHYRKKWMQSRKNWSSFGSKWPL